MVEVVDYADGKVLSCCCCWGCAPPDDYLVVDKLPADLRPKYAGNARIEQEGWKKLIKGRIVDLELLEKTGK